MNIVVLNAPSGAGKSTIAKRLLDTFPTMKFSISATTRSPRPHEKHGEHYYFLSPETFQSYIAHDYFIEYEEVYEGCFYGTLKSEIERIGNLGIALLDIDVEGAQSVKSYYQDDALLVFIQPPSIEVLIDRLTSRDTETEASLQQRIEKATYELTFADKNDVVIVNDNLEIAVQETILQIHSFLARNNNLS